MRDGSTAPPPCISDIRRAHSTWAWRFVPAKQAEPVACGAGGSEQGDCDVLGAAATGAAIAKRPEDGCPAGPADDTDALERPCLRAASLRGLVGNERHAGRAS